MRNALFARLPLTALALLMSLGATACAEDETRSTAQYSIAQFMESTSYGGASFSPDDSKLLVSHNGTGIFNVYAIPLGGGEPTALNKLHRDFAVRYLLLRRRRALPVSLG